MDEIASMMEKLDVASDRDQNVATIQLQNGDPQQVAQVLQSMFSNGNASRTGSSSQNSALQQRQQSSTTSMSTTSTSSSSGGGIGGGAGGRPAF
jgi:type II secretory pathway component GspD/PulD (secretin)